MKKITLFPTKKIILLISVISLSFGAFAQKKDKHTAYSPPTINTEKCGMIQHENYLRSIDPLYDVKKQHEMEVMRNAVKNLPQNKVVYTLPTVVHILYNTSTQNLTDAQIQNMIDLLNKDYSRTNADAGNTPTPFQGVASGMGIQFCLASTDPNGNPTTGVVHKSTTVTSFTTNNAVKQSANGGDDAWPVNQYFNIWVCNLGGGLLGYGEFPTNPLTNTYGAVVKYCTIPGPAACAPYNLNRTMTHELSHCFDLYHIWGDDNGACSGSDFVADTPNQAGATYGCSTFPKTDACTTSGNGIMYMNYMDYSDDNCMNMFTAGQKTRAQAAVQTYLSGVYNNSSVCSSSAVADDAGISVITAPSGTYCSTTITPIVVLKNFGSNALTSVTINYQVDATTVQTFSWTGNLASGATTNVTLAAITVAGGSHTFNANTSSPNGGTDSNPANNASTSSFTASSTGLALPFTEGFEGTTFVPAGWTLNNPDGGITWNRTTAAAKTGSASAFMDFANYNASAEIDEMVTPSLDLTTKTAPQLTFQVAYQLYTDPTSNPAYSDTLEILISTDCGATYTSLYKKSSTQLTTTTPAFSTTTFVPTANQWRLESVDLSAYGANNNAIIVFRGINDYENELYIDDINITGGIVTSINEVNQGIISTYPNPAKDVINVTFPSNKGNEISVYNLVGELIYSNNNLNNSTLAIDMSKQANGVYFLKIKSGNQVVTKKVILSK